jgi:hypothetical protein
MKSLPVIIIMSGLISLSCSRDSIFSGQNRNTVQFGNYNNMQISYPDTVIMGGYNQGTFFTIDFDGNGLDDIGLESSIPGSPGMGMHPQSRIFCLHDDVALLGYLENDTSFLNRYVQIMNGPNQTIEIYENLNVTCYRMDPQDSILSIDYDKFQLKASSKEEDFSLSDSFNTDTLRLSTDSFGYPYDILHISQDTVKYTRRNYFSGCNSFPENEILYIGLRIKKNDKHKLAWIKLSISDKYKIFLLETAIQNNWH